MTAGRVRAAVIGVGHLGRHHARILSDLEGVELVGVVDVNPQRAQEIAEIHRTKALAPGDLAQERGRNVTPSMKWYGGRATSSITELLV